MIPPLILMDCKDWSDLRDEERKTNLQRLEEKIRKTKELVEIRKHALELCKITLLG